MSARPNCKSSISGRSCVWRSWRQQVGSDRLCCFRTSDPYITYVIAIYAQQCQAEATQLGRLAFGASSTVRSDRHGRAALRITELRRHSHCRIGTLWSAKLSL